MKQQTHNSGILPWMLLAVPVLWLSAILAYGYEDGMTVFDLMGRFSTLLERPFATRQNRRPGEEHGSAHWGDPRQLDRKYRDKKEENNVILTQHIRMSLNSRKHQRNLLQIIPSISA